MRAQAVSLYVNTPGVGVLPGWLDVNAQCRMTIGLLHVSSVLHVVYYPFLFAIMSTVRFTSICYRYMHVIRTGLTCMYNKKQMIIVYLTVVLSYSWPWCIKSKVNW